MGLRQWLEKQQQYRVNPVTFDIETRNPWTLKLAWSLFEAGMDNQDSYNRLDILRGYVEKKPSDAYQYRIITFSPHKQGCLGTLFEYGSQIRLRGKTPTSWTDLAPSVSIEGAEIDILHFMENLDHRHTVKVVKYVR